MNTDPRPQDAAPRDEAPRPEAPRNEARADRLAHYLLRAVNRAIREHGLLAEGDRVLVAVSGGKDSLTLLDLLHRRMRSAREAYTLAAGHIVSDYGCGRAVSREWLGAWCAERGIPREVGAVQVAEELARTGANPCFRCAWWRRKALFEIAARLGCNVIAYGHHADDLAETALMNLLYSAEFRGMDVRREFFGEFTVVRPLAYVAERDILPFVQASGYPLAGEPCPAGANTKRSVARALLAQAERAHRGARRNILAALARAEAARPPEWHTVGEDIEAGHQEEADRG
jgi:tRNA 2-thiocytidine biosynthesis protein TtcA